MQIHIKLLCGRTLTLEVEQSTTIDIVKALITEKEGISLDQQRLLYEGKQLWNEHSLLDYNIVSDSYIHCVVRLKNGLRLFVQRENGKKITIECFASDSIEDVKSHIEEKTGIPAICQRLIFSGKQIDNFASLSDCSITREETIHLFLRQRASISFFVSFKTGAKFRLEAEVAETIGDVKNKIKAKTGSARKSQLLYLSEELLVDHCLLSSYKITDETTLTLVLQEYQSLTLSVMCQTGTLISVDVSIFHEVRSLKKKIQGIADIPADQQRLVFNSAILDDDRKTLKDYNIDSNSVLKLFIRYQSLVNLRKVSMDNRQLGSGDSDFFKVRVALRSVSTISLLVKSTSTIKELKLHIQDKEGIDAHRLRLLFSNVELDADAATLSCYQIKDQSELQAVIRVREGPTMLLLVRTWCNGTFIIEALNEDTIADFKARIARQQGIPVAKQHLHYFGRELEDDTRTIAESKVVGNSVLSLAFPVVVRTWKESEIVLNVCASSSVLQVKVMLYDALGILPERQSLQFGDKDLEDSAELCVYGITNASALSLFNLDWIHICVAPVNATMGEAISLDVETSYKVSDVMALLWNAWGIQSRRQLIRYKDCDLEAGCTLAQYNITHGAILTMDVT